MLLNPLKVGSLTELLFKIIDVVLVFAIPIIVVFIMWAGFLFVTAQGNGEKVGQARSALTWAVVGGVIILGAKILAEAIKGTIMAF